MIAALTGWPTWVISTLGILLFVLAFVEFVCHEKTSQTKVAQATCKKFKAFQREYLIVYYIVMFADWLQGTNMYTLYQGYGMNVGTLFLTGFLSAGVFGLITGHLIDSWGRKKACVVFCILEVRFW